MSTHDPSERTPPFGPALALLAVALISINLRPGATSVGPLLAEIRDALGLGATTAGVLTALPGFTFALAGGCAVALARRVGVSAGIMLGLVALVVTLLTRVLTDSGAVFLVLTAIGLAGMGLGNVLVPAWIKTHSRDGVRLMTIYSMGLTVGGAIGPFLAAPVAAVAPGHWRGALGMWGFVAILALVPWVVVALRDRVHRRSAGETPTARIWHSPTAIALTALFGLQSTNAYVQFGWLPQIYRDAGLSATSAGALTSMLAALGIFGGLIMPTVISRSKDMSAWMVAFGVLVIAGYVGLLLAPATVPWLWALLLGLSGFAFPTAIALITARTRNPHVTAQLSGFVQPVGYLLAGLGPFLVGVLRDLTGGWTLILVLLMTTGVAMTLAGLRVARPVLVDDEIGVGVPRP